MAFSYAQSRGLGWGFIAAIGTLKNLREPQGRLVARAVWEGYTHGRDALWLHGEDIETLFAEPLDAARVRLKIAAPVQYQRLKGDGVGALGAAGDRYGVVVHRSQLSFPA